MAKKGPPKGHPKWGGRKKGTTNLVTGQLREAIVQALSNVGGVAYLETLAKEHPAAFVSLIGRVLPTTVAPSEDAKSVEFSWKVTV